MANKTKIWIQVKLILLFLIPLLLLACNLNDTAESANEFEYDFKEADHDWESFFTDYHVEMQGDMELSHEYRSLPEPLNTSDNGHFLSSVNRSDDVKMLLKKEVDGLEPNTDYQVQFTVHFATNAPAECVGIGGAPGESVNVIAAVSNLEPEPFIEDDHYRLNIQHRGGPASWHENAILGNIANSRDCEDDVEFEMKELSSEDNHDEVTTDENGRAWIVFGTRSGFEGQTDIYFTYFRAGFHEVSENE